jgi:hypothetical protein
MKSYVRSLGRTAGIAACLVVVAAAISGSAQAADVRVVTGGGFTDVGGTVGHFVVRAEIGPDGVTGHIATQFHTAAETRPDRVEVRATCLVTVGSTVLVGGVVRNANAASFQGDFSHFALVLEDGGQTGDKAAFVFFLGSAEGTNPCLTIAPFLPALAMNPLVKGDVTFGF